MLPPQVVEFVVVFLLALLLASFAEYAVHRMMHRVRWAGKQHVHHHKEGTGQGWLGEFREYVLPTFVITWTGFLYSPWVGLGLVLGGVFYAAASAYSHQLQHERPELVFWMKRPVHYLHHRDNMWRHNFGILVDWWDRIFGTYKVVTWQPDRRPFQHPLGDFFRINWLGYRKTCEQRSTKQNST